ncbi:outer membrane autotransporter barrel domain protein [Lysobacter capsici]|nr:outer membrane autotransporter barrel domain protein [Lysobacter capsici]
MPPLRWPPVFREGISGSGSGSGLAASAQFGHRFQLGNNWAVVPQLHLSARAMHWQDEGDANGKKTSAGRRLARRGPRHNAHQQML